MSDNTLANDSATDATDVTSESQVQEAKTYSQQDVDNMMARMRGSLEKKLLKPYEDLGDPNELRALRTEAEKRTQEQQIKRGEFEKTLQELASKKDSEIQKRDVIIKEYKVNSPLLSAAAKYRAVAPEQVKSLLSASVRLNDSGEVEVVSQDGSVRYRDNGTALEVEDLVREFLDSNPHFVSATPATTNTKSSITNSAPSRLDVSKLDMKNPEHRALYKAQRKSLGLV
jgi:ribonucleotide reductase alpha subunit